MTVFKNYFKIVKKHLGTILMFSAISIGISIINTNYTSNEDYTNIRPTLAIMCYDDSDLSKNFISYMEKNASLVDIEDDKKEIQDALYTNKVDAIIRIPKNFTNSLLNENYTSQSGEKPTIDLKKSVQNTSKYAEILIERYFKIAKTYAYAGMSEPEIIDAINIDLAKEIDVSINDGQKTNMQKLAIYYGFENYAFLSIFIFIIGTIMCIFNKETIKKRNNVSKMNPSSFSRQLLMGHMTLTLGLWAIYVLISIILYKDLMFTINGLLLMANSLVFAITTTSLAYLIGNYIKNQNVISGIQNVVALGLSFISGCFVPIEFLDKNIVNFSKIFPSYWFIQGNYDIFKLTDFNYASLKPIITNYGIILIFGIFYYIVSKIGIKKKITQ